MITLADIEAARDRIAPHVRRTPILEASLARDPIPLQASVVMKLELNQVTGSFKARGAMNRLLGILRPDVRNLCLAARPDLLHSTIYQQLTPQALQFILPPAEAPPPEFGFEVQCSPKS